jgi:hypothetical protein
MRWLDLPPLAEFEDRFGMVRRLYGPSVLGRYQFAARIAEIGRLLEQAEGTWPELYRGSAQFRSAMDGALTCWGIQPDWVSQHQMEELLLYRRGEEGEAKGGYLMELLLVDDSSEGGQGMSLSEAIAAISTHCHSLQEALDLANSVPADLLQEVLKSRAKNSESGTPKEDQVKQQHLKANFDKLMAMAGGEAHG